MNKEQEKLFNELQLLHDRVCRAIGDPKRLMILYALDQAPRYVVELAEMLNFPQPTISRHLNALYQGGLVTKERQGQIVYYSLSDSRIIQALDLMRDLQRDRAAAQARTTAANETDTPGSDD